MTQLPTGSSFIDLGLMQRNVTHFSRRGVSDRGDTSGWTDDPEERRRKAMGYSSKTTLQMAKDMAMQRVIRDKNLEIQKAVEEFNDEYRAESLLSMHLKKDTQPKSKEPTMPPPPIEKKSETESDSEKSDSSSEDKKKSKKKDKKKKKSKKEK